MCRRWGVLDREELSTFAGQRVWGKLGEKYVSESTQTTSLSQSAP